MEKELSIIVKDINGQCNKIINEINKFKKLQQDISSLYKVFDYDEKARMRLNRLQEAFPDGFKQQRQQLEFFIAKINIKFKQLKTEIKNGHYELS